MTIRRIAVLLVLAAPLAASFVASSCQAGITIGAGFDLLAGSPYATYTPYSPSGSVVTSVPTSVGSYDFGSGPVNVGNTSWIQERQSTITLTGIGDSETTPLDFLLRQGISAQEFPFAWLFPGNPNTGYVYLSIDYGARRTVA